MSEVTATSSPEPEDFKLPSKINLSPAMKLSPGWSVMLNSGGPSMTVIDVGRETGMVFVTWMDISEGKPVIAQFHASTLQLAAGRANGHWPRASAS